jgi:hypothetical protein
MFLKLLGKTHGVKHSIIFCLKDLLIIGKVIHCTVLPIQLNSFKNFLLQIQFYPVLDL